MQLASRALRLSGNARVLRASFAVRGLHPTAANTAPSVFGTESRHSTPTETSFSTQDAAQHRNITTALTGSNYQSSRLRQLGPRAKANFNTAIARSDLAFSPFESSIIFPSLDGPPQDVFTSDIRVPFLPDNLKPARKPEPEVKVTKPVIYTVAATSTHIVAPSAIVEGLSFDLSFVKQLEGTRDAKNEGDVMMRALRV